MGRNFNPRSPYGERHALQGQARHAGLISIHAPHTGSDRAGGGADHRRRYFNPRSPYGERRARADALRALDQFQSTLPIRGATCLCGVLPDPVSISIHAPHTGSDFLRLGVPFPAYDFNPRSPYGERPPRMVRELLGIRISIHAPHTGSDPQALAMAPRLTKFQSTLPIRGATVSRV